LPLDYYALDPLPSCCSHFDDREGNRHASQCGRIRRDCRELFSNARRGPIPASHRSKTAINASTPQRHAQHDQVRVRSTARFCSVCTQFEHPDQSWNLSGAREALTGGGSPLSTQQSSGTDPARVPLGTLAIVAVGSFCWAYSGPTADRIRSRRTTLDEAEAPSPC
jgi:hypothetical protein